MVFLGCTCSDFNHQEALTLKKTLFQSCPPDLPSAPPLPFEDSSSQSAGATEPMRVAGCLPEQLLSETGKARTAITTETQTASREISHLL